MTKQPKVNSKDWANLPTERWNCATFTQFLVDQTQEKFGVEYEPTGGGSKQTRWGREMGMLKQAQEKYGNAVLRRFIERCMDEYKPKPEYPYVSFTFAYSYMSDRFPRVQSDIAAEQRQAEAEQGADFNDLKSWL